MLTHLKINKLFGLYDYDLTFSENQEDKIRFITATNGYGKSTILRLIDGIFNQHIEVFFKVPFSELLFEIDNAVLRVQQFLTPSIRKENEADVIDEEDDVNISFKLGNIDSEDIKLSRIDVATKSPNLAAAMKQVQMFFSSETCKFIDDKRLLREDAKDSELVRLADFVGDKLKHPDEDVDRKISVLRDIVNRSDFANKDMELSPDFGFRFVSRDESRTKLAMSDLSSGEQHIMLISLYMLFDAPQKAIILIDEPEMSFHLSWQGDYLKNLRQIVALQNVQCIIATHSPIIFDSEYELSIDLYDQMHKEEKA